ncbi:Protein kinase-like domain [Pseudocohnilembus persalinus]|uniref:Calcium-dependent protein kinase 1 n=1 Tax=Pseudocohnilembus persalinus TaxID=266149 RepID=A0A0V0QHH0_PSEPJ|nr:Protein kinase-like domain [Pseudocohnilembus persalinus]|eukprot:KRX01612.1 Protein kinase-like domain [Pseudocohnilembus persalinus]
MERGKDEIVVKKQWFIKTNDNLTRIEDGYDFDPKKIVGSGTYGQVVKGKKKGTKQVRAIKIIPKKAVKNHERFKREIDIMRELDHPNIIKLYETFEDTRNIYLVMEMCEGGELFDRILDKGNFSELEARQVFKQMIQAINYCHKAGIAHRDLKPENFLYLTKHDDSPIKLIDFGLSKNYDDKNKMTTKAGTPYYISPEVLQGNYDQSCDVWSSGVILYILLSGVPPFYGNTDPEILQAVKKGEYSFDIEEFQGVSTAAKDIIRKMITKPSQRATPEQLLNDPWMKEDIKNKHKNLSLNFNALKNFTQHHRLKKVALTFIASQLSETEISDLGKLFRQLDKNGDGVLTVDEIREGLSGVGSSTYDEINKIISSIDTDGSGRVDYTEFIAATIERSLYMKDEKLHMAFRMLDLNNDGKISKEELKTVLGNEQDFKNKGDEYWDSMIGEVDRNGDGEIDYNEFIEMMKTISLKNR